jgi:hypothetical protein
MDWACCQEGEHNECLQIFDRAVILGKLEKGGQGRNLR